MALKIWLGTTSSDFTAAANWSPANQPTSGDDVIIEGSNPIDGGVLSASGNLASFVMRGFTGQAGTAASPLIVDLAASSNVDIQTQGMAYIDFNASAVNVTVRGTANVSAPLYGLHISGAGVDNIHTYNGASVLVLETIDEDIVTHDSGDRIQTVKGADAVSFHGPGELIAYGSFTNIYASGQTCYYFGSGALTVAQAEAGSNLIYDSAGNITTLNAYGGNIDGSDSDESVTVTNLNISTGSRVDPGRNWTLPAAGQPHAVIGV